MALDLKAPPPKLQQLENGDLVTMQGTRVVCVFDQSQGVATEAPYADWALTVENEGLEGHPLLKSLVCNEVVLIGDEEFRVDFDPFTMVYPIRFRRPI